jgi:serine/threonine protein kinase/Tfp pilus assembly protein PilF
MDPKRWQQVREVFAAAQALPPKERPAFLAARCGDDLALRGEVESLLLAAASDALRSGHATAEIAPQFDAFTEVLPEGGLVGPYRLRERIGRGGMGQVFLAERADGQFQQTVAIKLLGVGLDDPASVARFRTEREILARLEHANIARLLDGGVTERGLPYLVMEYVRGEPVTAFCDRQRMAVAERLRLFQEICHAVQYAHQNLIVHRDLKPSNILVSEQEHVKLLDFGIAKLLEPDGMSASGEATRTATRLMTPAFASPEQLRGEPITTATDVYALGLLLYELLTGRRAQPVDDLSPAELERRICEADPERPSAAALAGEDASARAERRGGVSPQRLGRLLRGDLDTIVSKAMHKEPRRRYASAADLAEDVGRHLTGLPVRARPDTLAYRASRFVRRHRFGVAAAGSAIVVLIGFAVAMAAQAARIAREAEAKARVTEFLTDLFKVSDPSEARGNTITARELLDRGTAKIRESLQDQPEIQAQLMATMANVYLSLGLSGQAEQQAKLALETRRRVLGPDHRDTLGSMNSLANAYWRQGRLAEAEALHRETFKIARRVLGPEDPDTLTSMNGLAVACEGQGRYAEAEALNREALDIKNRVLGPEHPLTLLSRNNLATACHNQGRYAEAEALHRETLEISERVLGADHPDTLRVMGNLANAFGAQGRHAEAEALHRKTLAIQERVLGPEHPETVNSLYNLGCFVALQGKHAQALGHLREAVERGYSHPGMERDPDLVALRDDPEFQKLVVAATANRERNRRAREAGGP